MNKRQPPKARHSEPFWTAPRRKAQRRRVSPLDAACQAARRSAIALGECPHIRPLLASHRTQTIWPCQGTVILRVRPPGIDRLLKLIFIKEGSPCCN